MLPVLVLSSADESPYPEPLAIVGAGAVQEAPREDPREQVVPADDDLAQLTQDTAMKPRDGPRALARSLVGASSVATGLEFMRLGEVNGAAVRRLLAAKRGLRVPKRTIGIITHTLRLRENGR